MWLWICRICELLFINVNLQVQYFNEYCLLVLSIEFSFTAAFPCNLCWRVINIPQGGVHIYKRNYQMEQLQCTLEGLQMTEPPAANTMSNTSDTNMSDPNPTGSIDIDTDTMDSGICMEENPQFSIYPAPRDSESGAFRLSSAQAVDPLSSSHPFCHNHRGNICVAFRTTAGHLL